MIMNKHIKKIKKQRVARIINSPNLSKIDKSKIITHPLFNFTFVSRRKKFGLLAAKKDTRYEYNLLNKLYKLSQQRDLTSCIRLRKNLGVEPLPISAVKPNISSNFKKSKVYQYCNPSFYAFRTNKKGRVIGCIWQKVNIFYVLFLDPNHKAYKG